MQNCSYLITANSSFSYFGAYLNKNAKFILTPKLWHSITLEQRDLFLPKDWIKI